MKLTLANTKAKNYACLYYHYAKRIPIANIGFNVYNDAGEWCGCIIYARGACPRLANQFNLGQGQVLELVRVALNGKQEQTSKAVALSLKMLKQYCPLCRLVISFADCDQNHLGTIYQATNWIYVGTPGADIPGVMRESYLVFGKCRHYKSAIELLHRKCPGVHFNIENLRKYIDPNAQLLKSSGKRKYLYPMDKKMRNQIAGMALPYPKTDPNWTKIDREVFINKMEREGQN